MLRGAGIARGSARLEAVAQALEQAALTPGVGAPPPERIEIDALAWAVLVRGRRLRVLEWLSGAGMSLLNVLDGVESAFLAVAERAGLHDKFAVAELLRAELRGLDDWSDQVSRLEVLLVAARRAPPPRSHSASPRWGAVFSTERVDPRALEVHDRLPKHDIPQDQRAARLRAALSVVDGAPHSVPMIAGHGQDDEPGAVLALDDRELDTLTGLRTRPETYGFIGQALGSETRDELRRLGVLVQCP